MLSDSLVGDVSTYPMRLVALSVFVIAVACAAFPAPGRAEDTISEARLERLFRPVQGERMALSSDGHYLAYTEQVKKDLVINILDLDSLEIKSRLIVDEDRPTAFSRAGTRSQLRFMEWATADRLVYAPAPEVIASAVLGVSSSFLNMAGANLPSLGGAAPPPTVLAPIMVVNAAGQDGRQILDIRELQYVSNATGQTITLTPLVRGFAADRRFLLVEVRGNVAEGITTKTYRLNIDTGKLSIVDEDLTSDTPAFDREGQMRLLENRNANNLSSTFDYRPPNKSKWGKLPEPVVAGRRESFLTSPQNYFGERAIPLGFDYDPNVLIYASNVGRDTYGIYGYNLTTQQRTALALEHPHRDLASIDSTLPSQSLIFDKFRSTFVGVHGRGPLPLTVWADPELAQVQRTVEQKFPQRSIRINEWNDTRTRFLVTVTGGTEPGRTYLFHRNEGLMVELMRRTPWLPNADLHDTRYFAFTTPDGTELTGFLTTPRRPRINPPPVIIWLAPGLPPRPHLEFDAQAQVFADMGFVVCRLNNRGVLGLGMKHSDALRNNLDAASGLDAAAAVAWLAQQQKIDRKRIVMLGEGFAGHLALRATQVNPGLFRCSVVFDPIINLMSWTRPEANLDRRGGTNVLIERRRIYLEAGGASLSKVSVTAHGDELNTPVLIISRGDVNNDAQQQIAAGVSQLRILLKRHDIPTSTVEYEADFVQGNAVARAKVYRQMEEFLNLNLYNFDVKIGPTKELK